MKKLTFTVFLLWIVVCGLWTITYAEIPRLINYQGRLTDKEGKPVADGTYLITFRIFDAKTGGNQEWEEKDVMVPVEKGIFSVLLGSKVNLGLPFNEPYFLEIQVEDDEPLYPRQQIASAGYAIRAEKAERAETILNIEASSTPEANKLLPLDENAKLQGGVINTNRVEKRNGDFYSGSNFTEVPDLSLNITSGKNQRFLISVCGRASSTSDAGHTFIDVSIDGKRLGGEAGGLSNARQSGLGQTNQYQNISFTILTDFIPEGEHTVRVLLQSGTLRCNNNYPAILSVVIL